MSGNAILAVQVNRGAVFNLGLLAALFGIVFVVFSYYLLDPNWHSSGGKSSLLEPVPPIIRSTLFAFLGYFFLRASFGYWRLLTKKYQSLLTLEGVHIIGVFGHRNIPWSDVAEISFHRIYITLHLDKKYRKSRSIFYRRTISIMSGWISDTPRRNVLDFISVVRRDLLPAMSRRTPMDGSRASAKPVFRVHNKRPHVETRAVTFALREEGLGLREKVAG